MNVYKKEHVGWRNIRPLAKRYVINVLKNDNFACEVRGVTKKAAMKMADDFIREEKKNA